MNNLPVTNELQSIAQGLESARQPRLDPQAPVLGRMGNLQTRLARCASEIEEAQRLRSLVFGGNGATLDADAWDNVCEHLLVIDEAGKRIVGTYRLFASSDSAVSGQPFYTAQEFSIGPLMERHRGLEFMELGRSCVLPEYRTKRTLELMWHGVWAHVLARGVDVLIGCASFPGTDPQAFAETLSFLHHFAPPLDGWQVRACAAETSPTALVAAQEINAKRALHSLPPLIKGYLRLGARFSQEAAIDRAFGTTDVLVILPVAGINPRYVEHYGADARRYAAGS
ncbi:MAG TPA: GNAT family N-acyltransferase [Rhizobiaceae bacterium]|nr:GNAT family N-acyltransferase [Rhizobiaceae bacterium]